MKERTGYRLHVGTASLLLVFLTLCLVSFSALSMAGAQADLRLSEKYHARTIAYYAAVAEAERFIGDTMEQGMTTDSVTKDFFFEENQYLRIVLVADEGGIRVAEYRVHTDDSSFTYDDNPFRVKP